MVIRILLFKLQTYNTCSWLKPYKFPKVNTANIAVTSISTTILTQNPIYILKYLEKKECLAG